jgi:cephalosporin-C deacetylase-like acetyl esterase
MSTALHPDYPDAEAIDAWCDELYARALGLDYTAEVLAVEGPKHAVPRHVYDPRYVRFDLQDQPSFYGYWQRAPGPRPAPLLLHVPGYGGEMSAHPELVQAGFNVLHINPLGYCTPDGFDLSRQANNTWPVLPDTAASHGERGYVDWLTQALVAARWAESQESVCAGRIGCFGTSQGGGGALLLGSLLREKGIRAVAADLPFLTNFPLMSKYPNLGAYGLVLGEGEPTAGAWRGLGFIDTLSHAHRLDMPVLLTAGTADVTTPPESIKSLFEVLPGTRSYMEFAGLEHGYTPHFIPLANTWFRLYL